jgi:O-antigen/teichoic acid export membrane protein
MIQSIKQKLSGLDTDLREVVRGSALAFAVKLLAAVSAFSANVAIARLLGADEAGIFFLVYTIILLATAVGRLGLDQTFVRFIAVYNSSREWGSIKSLYSTGIAWSLILSFGIALVLWAGADALGRYVFAEDGFADVLRAATPALPLVALFGLQAAALQGLKRVVESLLTLSAIAPLTLLGLTLAMRPQAADDVAILFVVSALVALVAGGFWWFRQWQPRQAALPVSKSQMIASCLPLFLASVTSLVSNSSGQLLIGAWATSADVAIFNAAQRTAVLTSFVLVAVNSISAPKFAALYAAGRYAALRRTALNSTRLMVLVAVPPLALMIFFPSEILGVFGPAFPEGERALQILAAGQFISVASGSVGYLLAMTGHERILRNVVFVAAAACIALGIFLVPRYGLHGAAIATAIGMALQNLLCVWYTRRLLGINTLMFWRVRQARPKS